MNSDDSALLQRIAQRLEDHISAHENDRDEAKERYRQDRERQDQWRQGIESKLEPIFRDHQFVVRVIKWIPVTVGGVLAALKGIFLVKDHLKP